MRSLPAFLLVLAAACSAASGSRGAAVAAPVPQPELAGLVRAGDERWEHRDDPRELALAISAWARAADAAEDPALWVKLARASYVLGELCASPGTGGCREPVTAIHERGRAWAARALMASSGELRRVAHGEAVEGDEAIAAVERADVPALFWYASNLRARASAEGGVALQTVSPRVNRMMQRCLALDETFFYGGAHRHFGVFYARAPLVVGGDLERSRQHFESSLRLAPDYLLTRVLWAEFWATKKEDRDGFRRELEYVLAHPEGGASDIAPENRLAKRRAARLLSRVNELFDPSPTANAAPSRTANAPPREHP